MQHHTVTPLLGRHKKRTLRTTSNPTMTQRRTDTTVQHRSREQLIRIMEKILAGGTANANGTWPRRPYGHSGFVVGRVCEYTAFEYPFGDEPESGEHLPDGLAESHCTVSTHCLIGLIV